MKRIAGMIAVAACLTLSACATAPEDQAPQSMDFVWGCWVQKQAFGRDTTVFLRLLPNADRTAYEGQLTVYVDNQTQPGGRASFARDGSRATFFLRENDRTGGSGARAPEPAGWPAKKLLWRAFFTPQPAPHDDKTEYLIAEGDKEHLIISITDRDGAGLLPVLDLERDGCD